MKKFLIPLCAAAGFCTPLATAQKVGDAVTTEVFGKLEWVQGVAPAAWEPGKLYVLECWATWCGPCIAAIPHVDALYDKYEPKGLRVIGVNVWEDGKDKVVEFVKKKGDGMSYPVAYTGKGGAFETDWLKPAGVKGIPHAFLVKDGKVLAAIHPAKLSDELVETLLAGGDAEKKALEEMNQQQAKDSAEAKARMAYSEAMKKNDPDAMAAAIGELKNANPKSFYIPLMENEVLVARGEWATLDKLIEGSGGEKMSPIAISSLASTLTNKDNVPKETLVKVIVAFEATPELTKSGPFPLVVLGRACWKADQKDKALAHVKEAVEGVKAQIKAKASAPADAKPMMELQLEPFEKLVASVEGGTFPTAQEFGSWLVSASAGAAKARAAAAAPAAATAATAATPVVPSTPTKATE